MIKNLLKSILFKLCPFLKKDNQIHLEIGNNCNVEGIRLQLFNQQENKKYIKIGNNSFIKGDFIFDNNLGFVSIGNRSFIGGSSFLCINGIEIGDDVMISWGCTFIDNNSHSTNWTERQHDVADAMKGNELEKKGAFKDWSNVKSNKIIVQNKVWVGFNCIILKGVTIGEGSIIAAGSVVTKNVPDWVMVAGNPAKFVKNLNE